MQYMRDCHNGPESRDFKFKYTEVLTGGKIRPLTMTPAHMNALRPLHKCIYNHLRKEDWLLVGPPTAKKFSRAGFRFDGTPILSGDYKSATDNLSVEIAEVILDEILNTSRLPFSLRSYAFASLRPSVEYPSLGASRLTRGQMMGSLLSFPLLCLQNYCATTYALGKVPMLINGDDVAAETLTPSRWFDVLPMTGLEPEKDKTGVSSTKLSLNSTEFLVEKGEVRIAPFVRLSQLGPQAVPLSLGRTHNEFVANLKGEMRLRASRTFIAAHKRTLTRMQLSLHSLGFSRTVYDADKAILRLHEARVANVDRRERSLPHPPVPHNVVLSDFVEVDERTISPSIKRLVSLASCHDTVLGKWNVEYSARDVRDWFPNTFPPPPPASFDDQENDGSRAVAAGRPLKRVFCPKLTTRVNFWYGRAKSHLEAYRMGRSRLLSPPDPRKNTIRVPQRVYEFITSINLRELVERSTLLR
jgi:hypothetical protein